MVDNMKTIYIHIGAPKTGTSAIQHFLKDNRNKLLEKGFLYCNTGMTENSGQAKLAWNLKDINFGNKVKKDIWDNLDREIMDHNGDIILSSEYFWILSGKEIYKLKEIFNDLQVKVVVYLRRQDEWVIANVLQQIKIFEKEWPSIEEHIYANLNNAYYYPIINNWSKIFNQSNLIVRPYEKQQFYKGNIFADFLFHCFNMELTEEFKLPKKNINPRLSRDAVEYKRFVNNLPINNKFKNGILKPLLSYSQDIDPKTHEPFQDHMLLSPNERIQIINRFEEDNKKVALEFLKQSIDNLFISDPPVNSTHTEYKGLDLTKTVEISKYILKDKFSTATDKTINDKLICLIIRGVINEISK